jgi:hypothetical protein
LRRRTLLLVPCASWVAACSLDWGSLEPPEGGVFDGSFDGYKPPDAHADTKNDVGPTTDADNSDVTSDDAGGDASNEDGASDGATDAGTPESGTDASDGGVDAGDASASDASDAGDAGCPYTFTGTLATWDLSALTGITTSAPATATASGMSAGAISRSSGLTAVSASGGINSSGWSTASTVDKTLYYTFTVTPPAKCAMAITSVYLDTLTSGNGPSSGDVGTSADTFTALSAFTPNTAASVSLSVTGETTTIEIRAYGYNALLTAGTMRIRNTMTVSGSLK